MQGKRVYSRIQNAGKRVYSRLQFRLMERERMAAE